MIDTTLAHAAWYLAVFLLGALLSAPLWMGYALMKDRERREWEARRRQRRER